MTTYQMKKGDTSPAIQASLVGADGTPTDLTGSTVTFYMRLRGAGVAKVSGGSCSIVGTASDGVVRYQWVAGDVDTPGTFDAEFRVAFPGSFRQTIPSNGFQTIEVDDTLA